MKVFPIEEARALVYDEKFAEHIAYRIKSSANCGCSIYSETFDSKLDSSQLRVLQKYQDAGYNLEWSVTARASESYGDGGWPTRMIVGHFTEIKIKW